MFKLYQMASYELTQIFPKRSFLMLNTIFVLPSTNHEFDSWAVVGYNNEI